MAFSPDLEAAEQEIRADRRQHRLMKILLALAIATVLITLSLTVFHFQDSATLHAQQATQARSDCVRALSDDRSTLRDTRDSLLSQLILVVVTQPLDQPRFTELKTSLNAAIMTLTDLPPLQKAVMRQCPGV